MPGRHRSFSWLTHPSGRRRRAASSCGRGLCDGVKGGAERTMRKNAWDGHPSKVGGCVFCVDPTSPTPPRCINDGGQPGRHWTMRRPPSINRIGAAEVRGQAPCLIEFVREEARRQVAWRVRSNLLFLSGDGRCSHWQARDGWIGYIDRWGPEVEGGTGGCLPSILDRSIDPMRRFTACTIPEKESASCVVRAERRVFVV